MEEYVSLGATGAAAKAAGVQEPFGPTKRTRERQAKQDLVSFVARSVRQRVESSSSSSSSSSGLQLSDAEARMITGNQEARGDAWGRVLAFKVLMREERAVKREKDVEDDEVLDAWRESQEGGKAVIDAAIAAFPSLYKYRHNLHPVPCPAEGEDSLCYRIRIIPADAVAKAKRMCDIKSQNADRIFNILEKGFSELHTRTGTYPLIPMASVRMPERCIRALMCVCARGPNEHLWDIALNVEEILKELKKHGTAALRELLDGWCVLLLIGKSKTQIDAEEAGWGPLPFAQLKTKWLHIAWQAQSPWASSWHVMGLDRGQQSLSVQTVLESGRQFSSIRIT